MRRGGLAQTERLGEHRSAEFCCDCVSASLRPSASRAFASRMVDQFLLLTALRQADLDLAAVFQRERFGEQRSILDLVREEDAARRRLVVIELREERTEHLARFERAVGTREIGAVAPVLAGAEEEHLDAGVPAPADTRRTRPLLHAARIDPLAGLGRRERRQRSRNAAARSKSSASDACSISPQARPAPPGFCRRGTLRLAHQFGIVGVRNLAGAGRRAALDLMQQARPRPAHVHGVRAGADQERALQRGDGPADRLRGGKRPVVVAGLAARPAMLGVIGGVSSAVITIYGNDLSSRRSTLKRGRSRLIRFASSSSASVSVAV